MMMKVKNEDIKYFDIAADAAIRAGREILNVYATDFDVESKADDSPLTKADMAAHHVISDALKETNLPVLSEEGSKISYSERKNWDKFWLVDPLDGTKEFVKRNGEFTVNIALIDKQQPVMGIIYAPVLDIMYFGSTTEGAYKLEQVSERKLSRHDFELLAAKAEKLPISQQRDKYTVVASRSHLSPETRDFIEDLKKNKGEVDSISRGSSLKLCMIAEGTADVYPRFAPTMEWDTGAGHAIVLSAGGKLTKDNRKDALLYNKEKLLNPWFIAFSD